MFRTNLITYIGPFFYNFKSFVHVYIYLSIWILCITFERSVQDCCKFLAQAYSSHRYFSILLQVYYQIGSLVKFWLLVSFLILYVHNYLQSGYIYFLFDCLCGSVASFFGWWMWIMIITHCFSSFFASSWHWYSDCFWSLGATGN